MRVVSGLVGLPWTANPRKCKDPKCLSCGQSDEQCVSCEETHASMNYQCLAGQSAKCSVDHCESCFSKSSARGELDSGALRDERVDGCSKCRPGYSIAAGTDDCFEFERGCLRFDPSKNWCDECEYGWYMSQGFRCLPGER